MNKRAFRWIDIDKIGLELAATHPDMSPDQPSTAALQDLIVSLKFFNDSPFPPNALYLDLIRDAWEDAVTGVSTDNIKITTNLAGSDDS